MIGNYCFDGVSMKIKATINRFGAINCQEQYCPFLKKCANHETAGQYREEDGFSPEITVEYGPALTSINPQVGDNVIEVHCATIECNPEYGKYETLPIHYDQMRRGAVRFVNGEISSREWEDYDYDKYDSEGEYYYRDEMN